MTTDIELPNPRVFVAARHAFRPPFGNVVVQDFCPITDEAHTELLQTLLVLEMFDNVEIEVPVDDPLPLKLSDQRAAQTTGGTDFLWVRINDVPEALGAREYSADTELVLDVVDPLNLAGGRFLLQTRDAVGKCTPHDGPADVQIGLADLATIYMGAHQASQLVRADRITELREGALQDLDAAFSTDRAPYCGTHLFDDALCTEHAAPQGFRCPTGGAVAVRSSRLARYRAVTRGQLGGHTREHR